MKMLKFAFFSLLICFVFHVSFNHAQAAITEKDIVAVWLFDDGSGNILKDSSGNEEIIDVVSSTSVTISATEYVKVTVAYPFYQKPTS